MMTSGTTEPAPSEGPLAGCAPSPVTTVGLPVGLSTHPPLAVPSMNWERRVGHPPTPLAGRNAADRLPGGEPCAGEPHARFGKGGLGRSRPRRDGSHAPEGKPPGLSPSAVPATPNQFPTSPLYLARRQGRVCPFVVPPVVRSTPCYPRSPADLDEPAKAGRGRDVLEWKH